MYFHLMIRPTHGPPDLAGFFPNLQREQLEERVLEPYRQGRSITLSGETLPCAEITQIRILQTAEPLTEPRFKKGSRSSYPFLAYQDDELEAFSLLLSEIGEEVTDEFITGHPGHDRQVPLDSTTKRDAPSDTRKVFVVHGRNTAARDALFTFLRSIGLDPLEWSEAVQATGKPTPYVGEVLDAAFSTAQAVVVLFTPDDETRLKVPLQLPSDPPHETELTGQARPNVLFEAGMAMAGSQDRTVLVELGPLRPFSDIAGLHTIRLDNGSQRRQELAQRLRAAGCAVNLDGTDWHTAGGFDTALQLVEDSPGSVDGDGAQPGSVVASQLSEEAKALLLEAARDGGDGDIVITRTSGSVIIQANRKGFGEPGNRRSEAKWEAGIQQLLDWDLINDPHGEGKYYEVTNRGFQVADHLRTSD